MDTEVRFAAVETALLLVECIVVVELTAADEERLVELAEMDVLLPMVEIRLDESEVAVDEIDDVVAEEFV